MKYEIEIELPEHLRDKWRPVAYRHAQAGEWVFMAIGSCVGQATCTAADCLIVEPIDPRNEIKKWWPKEVGFDWITREELIAWGWFGDKPYFAKDEFHNKEHEMTNFSVVFELFGVNPPKLANTADQVWGNPWRE